MATLETNIDSNIDTDQEIAGEEEEFEQPIKKATDLDLDLDEQDTGDVTSPEKKLQGELISKDTDKIQNQEESFSPKKSKLQKDEDEFDLAFNEEDEFKPKQLQEGEDELVDREFDDEHESKEFKIFLGGLPGDTNKSKIFYLPF